MSHLTSNSEESFRDSHDPSEHISPELSVYDENSENRNPNVKQLEIETQVFNWNDLELVQLLQSLGVSAEVIEKFVGK